jgi:hypothetical protein
VSRCARQTGRRIQAVIEKTEEEYFFIFDSASILMVVIASSSLRLQLEE